MPKVPPGFHVSKPLLSLGTCPETCLCGALSALGGQKGLKQGQPGSGELGTAWGDVLSCVPLADICFIALKSLKGE